MRRERRLLKQQTELRLAVPQLLALRRHEAVDRAAHPQCQGNLATAQARCIEPKYFFDLAHRYSFCCQLCFRVIGGAESLRVRALCLIPVQSGHPFQSPAKSGSIQMESVAAFTVLGGCIGMESLADLLWNMHPQYAPEMIDMLSLISDPLLLA